MTGLMLHCGGEIKPREAVFAVPVPRPTDSYVPLPYESFVTRIEKQLATENIRVKQETLGLGKDGQRLFGLLEVEPPNMGSRDYGCVLGLRNSYDKSCSAGLCIGATVFVCDNLSFHGSLVTFQRKHTANLLRDLSWIITETVAKLPALFAAQSATFKAYRRAELADKEVHDLVIRCYDRGGFNLTDIPHVLKEWREPRHPEFRDGGKTAWRLFNAATETIKGDLWRLPARTRTIHEVLDEVCLLPRPDGDVQLAPKEQPEMAVAA